MAEGEHTMSATITLPDNLARDAALVGLTPEAIEAMVRDEINRRREAESQALDFSQMSNRELIERINQACDAGMYEEDEEYKQAMKQHHRRMMQNVEW